MSNDQSNIRFSAVVTKLPQWNQLTAKLETNERWQELAHRLLDYKVDDIEQLERTSKLAGKLPSYMLLVKWKDTKDATMGVILKHLEDMDRTYGTFETAELLRSWISPPSPGLNEKFSQVVIDNTKKDQKQSEKSNAGSPLSPENLPKQVCIIVCHDALDSLVTLQSETPSFKKKLQIQTCPAGDVLPLEFTGNIDLLLNKADLVVALMTKDCLKLKSFVHALERVQQLNKKIVIVHSVKSCKFPGKPDQPASVQPLFQQIAVPLVDGFVEYCWKRVLHVASKDPNVHEDITTDAFLSHKQDTAQAIATTFFEALKNNGLKPFLDVQTEFVLHDLGELVSKTSLFVFIVTQGIFDSYWCRHEFEAAVKSNKKIFVVKPLDYQMPKLDTLPADWEPYKQYFVPARLKEYNATHLQEFVAKMVKSVKKAQEAQHKQGQ